MAETAQATAVDAQAAAQAADAANIAAQQAIANAANVAAQAEAGAAEQVAVIAAKTEENINRQEADLSWLRDHARTQQEFSQTAAQQFQTQQAELTEIRKETGALKTVLTGIVELLTPKASTAAEAQTTEPQTLQNGDAADQKAAETKAKKRRLRVI